MKLKIALIVLALAVVVSAIAVVIHDRNRDENYTGGLQDGEPHGFGIMKYPGGALYAGEFQEGLRHGRGSWIHPDGIRYAGQWQLDEYHGRGTLILAGGSRYDGAWVEGKKHGPGIQIWPDGKRYTGWWNQDRYNGYGYLERPDGFSYRGYFVDGRRQGRGSAFFPDGTKYFGEWHNDQRHGTGRLIEPDGTTYEGPWVEDKLHGEGTITYPDGANRFASWIDGILQEVPVEAVTLTPESINLIVGGESAHITVEIVPAEATYWELTWSSSDTEIASVDGGKVTPVGPGNAVVTVATADGEHSATCRVTVSPETETPPAPPDVSVTGVRLDRTQITLRVGETATLIATITPADATNKGVSWVSSAAGVATVTRQSGLRGLVKAVSPGETRVTVTTADGRHTATCKVTILPQREVERVVVPRLIGKPVREIEKMLTETGLVLGQVRREHHHSVPANHVVSQEPGVGAIVTAGSVVHVVVSDGPAPEEPPDPDPDPDPDPEPEPDPEPNPDPDPNAMLLSTNHDFLITIESREVSGAWEITCSGEPTGGVIICSTPGYR